MPLQVLPFASDETLKVLEENLGSLPAITDLLHMGFSAAQLTNAILGAHAWLFNLFSVLEAMLRSMLLDPINVG